ncbi:transporter [Priestia megaterium]|nr:transporter [Priestia megaterium]
MYPYYYDPRFQVLFPIEGQQGARQGGFPGGQPGGFPGGQPGGFPGGQPGGFPGGPDLPSPPGQGGGQGGPPSGPPPSFTPQLTSSGGPAVYAVDPGSIYGCLYKYTYIWAKGGRSYWFYPTYVGRRSVSGYRWTGFYWVYAGIDLNQIREFQCY